ncbi:hypothetical protein AB0C42_21900 [Micromonospora taraxaci]|uniref:hypothetical protein n=1 Tax=Micromonospora taraxaci TaxID=1316803 RepID=UPI0033ED5824
MRVLAHRAEMPAHAVYRHVRNRADLLGAMAERITATSTPRAAPPPPWFHFGLRGLLDGLLTDPARYGGERARTGEDH